MSWPVGRADKPPDKPYSSLVRHDETVAVAVSGGADSLLALVLLREQGCDVLAVHGLFLPPRSGEAALLDALDSHCRALGVPFQALDLRREFEERVAAPFAAEYASGRTPNPCARCNPRLKFGALFDKARELGATRLATGHYAQLRPASRDRATDFQTESGEGAAPGRERPVALQRGADPVKDQSYFLSLTPLDRLQAAVFPLGGLTKTEVRAELARRGMTPPLPSESQEVCFVPDDDYRAWLAGRGAELTGPGPIVDSSGKTLGRHQGLWRHTIGQRRGLGVPFAEPLYVLDKDAASNVLVVGVKGELAAAGCVADEVNLLLPFAEWPEEILLQTRYRQKAEPARARLVSEAAGDALELHFAERRERPAPGQIAAIYDAEGRVLGAGVVRRAFA